MAKGKSESEGIFDYTTFEKEVVSGLKNGQGLLGPEGLLKPLIAKFVEAALFPFQHKTGLFLLH